MNNQYINPTLMPQADIRQTIFRRMTTGSYEENMDKTYLKLKKRFSLNIVPTRLGIHLANTRCPLECIFCVSNSEKVEERTIQFPEETLQKLEYLLNLVDDNNEYIKEFHLDGDSSDPILPGTIYLFCEIVKLIRETEKRDGRNRIIYLITNGVFLHKLPDNIIKEIDLFNISVNAYDRNVYKDISGKDLFENGLANINYICKYRDVNMTNQFIRVSYVVSRDKTKGINNFSETGIKQFAARLREIGVDDLKFRFDFFEEDKLYHEYVMKFIDKIANDFKPMTVFIQKPNQRCAGFKYCLAKFEWPVLAPNNQIFECAHAMKSALTQEKSVYKIDAEEGCNEICTPFMYGLNKRFNQDMEEDPNFRKMMERYSFSESVYPIICR